MRDLIVGNSVCCTGQAGYKAPWRACSGYFDAQPQATVAVLHFAKRRWIDGRAGDSFCRTL